jgi:hypothetical protein
MRHNCPNTNLVGWGIQSPFRHVQHIQLGARRLRTSSSKTHGYTQLSRRRQTGALTSRNFHWNIALSAPDKAIRRCKSHYHGLINGRIYICLSIYGSKSFVGPWPLFFSFLILYTFGRTPLTGDQPVARPLPTHRINAHRHPCLEWIRTHDPSVRGSENSSCLRRRGHCDRHIFTYKDIKFINR